jgi:hypothetical protein
MDSDSADMVDVPFLNILGHFFSLISQKDDNRCNQQNKKLIKTHT